MIQVRDRSSATWKGTRISSRLHSRTCITSRWLENEASAASFETRRPSYAFPQRFERRANQRSAAEGAGIVLHPARSSAAAAGMLFIFVPCLPENSPHLGHTSPNVEEK